MKTLKFLLLPTLLFWSLISYAQFDLGIKAGANYNYTDFSPSNVDFSFDNATSFSGGAFMRGTIKKISLQAEGLFITRKGTVTESTKAREIDFVSFDLPLIVGYKIIGSKGFSVRLNAGVIPSYFISSLGDLENANFKDSFYSATAGLSIDIPLILLDFRYQAGMGDYYQFQQANNLTGLSSNLFTISVGWKIL
jgi:hypothetical protein